jgi:predicted lipoprotein with Yx(FWY)xxD motif
VFTSLQAQLAYFHPPLEQGNAMNTPFTASLAALGMLVACASPYAASPAMTQSGVLTNPAGMTLYVFDKDVAGSGKSACNGDCAAKWPPLAAAASDTAGGDYAIITRDDGAKQWSYKGKPLYLWINDKKPGDMTGDGVNNVWHAAKP